jgi:uroporphyrin-III C-methyltransferase
MLPGAKRGSLVIVGAGINGPAQTTLEAVECVRWADAVFYVVPDPTTAYWIKSLNSTATTLDDLYAPGKNRVITYRQMAARIADAAISGKNVCAVFYGHPGILVNASHWAIKRVRRAGLPAKMAPGISAEACLLADLGVNPGDNGLQSYEATDFLASRRRIDPTANLVLWQAGVLGEPDFRQGMRARPDRLGMLAASLARWYPLTHKVTVYQAATFPANPPSIRRIPLSRLARSRILPGATLFIAPLAPRAPRWEILRWYEQA